MKCWGDKMKLKICSIIASEFLAPDNILQWNVNADQFMFVEVLHPVIMLCRKKRMSIQAKQMIIGQQFRLLNPSSTEFAQVRGAVFCIEPNPHNLVPPTILDDPDETATALLSLISKTLPNKGSSEQFPKEIDVQFDFIFGTLNPAANDDAHQPKKPVGKIDPRLIMINRYIRQHFHLPLTLNDLADLIQCNPVYLSNTYSKVFDISPIKHIHHLKMEKAKGLLQHSDFSVHEIAEQLSYVSCSQFASQFKKYHGLTPRECKREHILITN